MSERAAVWGRLERGEVCVPMAMLPFDEDVLSAALDDWLPPVEPVAASMLVALARAPAQASLDGPEGAAHGERD